MSKISKIEEGRARRRKYNREYYQKHKQKTHTENERKLLLQCRIPASLIGRLHRLTSEAIATGKWPYRTNTDTVTDLLIRGLGTLKGDETIDEMLPFLQMSQRFAASEAHRREMQLLFLKVKTEISQFLGVGAKKEALGCYGGSLEEIEKMRAGVWRDWLMAQLRDSFPEMEKYYRKGGKLPATVKFYSERRYKLTMDEEERGPEPGD